MAQIKRKKVSRKAVQGQKGNKTNFIHTTWFKVVASITIVLLVCGALAGGHFLYKYLHDEEEYINYFTDEDYLKDNPILSDNGVPVEFYNGTIEGIKISLVQDYDDDKIYKKHIFFLAYTPSDFYPDEAIDKGKDKDNEKDVFLYNKTDKAVVNGAIDIKAAIDAYNAEILANDPDNVEDLIYFYIIDTSYGNNNNVFTDQVFGAKGEDSKFLFGYLNGVNGFTESYKLNNESKTICATNKSTFTTTTVGRVLTFIENDLQSE